MAGPDRPSQAAAGETGPRRPASPHSDSGPRTPITTMTRRAEFLACARAKRAHAPGLVLQGRQRRPGEAQGVRVGFTCSRKVGKAVARNRARRRLREAARAVMPQLGREGWDYVLIGRPDATVLRRFAELVHDLEAALGKIHGDSGRVSG